MIINFNLAKCLDFFDMRNLFWLLQKKKYMKKCQKYFLQFFLVATTMTLLSACTTSGEFLTGQPQQTSLSTNTTHATAQVVFFNDSLVDTKSSATSALVISTQGNVISGLHPQQYTILPVCKGTHNFQITQVGFAATSIEITATENTVHFVKLIPTSKMPGVSYQVSSHARINDVIGEHQPRSFLVPRYQANCVVPEQPKTFNLDFEALFSFDGADIMDVVVTHPLDEVVRFIQANDSQKLRVTVSGYTDHLGTQDYNQTLSEQRAQAVANYLKSKGFEGPIQVFGFGSADPVVTNCPASLAHDELIQCLQPNRRVTVSVLQAN